MYIFLMAGPLRGRGKKRAGPLRKKELILKFCCNLKIKGISLETTYQNSNTENVGKVVVFYQACSIFLSFVALLD